MKIGKTYHTVARAENSYNFLCVFLTLSSFAFFPLCQLKQRSVKNFFFVFIWFAIICLCDSNSEELEFFPAFFLLHLRRVIQSRVFNVSDQHAYVHHISFSTLNSFSLISYQLRARRKRFFSSLCFLFSIFPFTFIFLFYQLKACVYCCFFNPHQFEILFGWLIFVLQLG